MKRFLKFTAILLVLALALAVLGGIAACIALKPYADSRVDDALLHVARHGGTSRLYVYDFSDRAAREGSVREIGPLCGGNTYYEYAAIDKIPAPMIDAFVAVEDKRFWEHEGVDFLRTGEAAIAYLQKKLLGKGGRSFGASTITQQLVKNLTGDDRVSIDRKLTEMFCALDLERRADKREVLEMYLNVINLADGCRGVGAAAKHYFSKDISALSVGECACIAAITNNPVRYNPITHPEQNEQRRQLILSCMLAQGYLDEQSYLDAAQPVALAPEVSRGSRVASWYEDMVVGDVINDLCATYGYSRAAASNMVYSGGLRIYAAMDERVQNILEEYYATTDIFSKQERSAMMIIDPHTGDILGVAGAIGQKGANRLQNYATDTRLPPGSAIKPLSVYAPALERGIINWASVYDDVPLRFVGNTPWPRNAHYAYHGLTTVATALAESVNTVAVEILEDVGRERSLSFLRDRLGMQSLTDSDMTQAGLALGQFAHGVTLRELTDAYTVFLDGNYMPWRSYFHVTDADGTVMLSNTVAPERVLSRENAAIMTKMMQGVVSEGTARGKVSLARRVQVAGKTGTTQRGVDRWFVGYTPAAVGGVWTGYDYPSYEQSIEGNVSITVWDEVMTRLYDAGIFEGSPDVFSVPKTVHRYAYCADSGHLPGYACTCDLRGDRTRVGYFTTTNRPHTLCSTHELVCYDTLFGGVAGPDCPLEALRDAGLLRGFRSFDREVYIKDAPYFLWDAPPAEGEYRGTWYATPSKTLPCPAHTRMENDTEQTDESEQIYESERAE
ncbi:MAG: transglycosylase domain-containing protein [Clostridia bacterium]|nr:transglycosylase domain-containing protein [Clostridia bacterium]